MERETNIRKKIKVQHQAQQFQSRCDIAVTADRADIAVTADIAVSADRADGDTAVNISNVSPTTV
jgi:hypothetical protein